MMELPPGGAAMELPPDCASHPRAQPGDAAMPFPDPADDKLGRPTDSIVMEDVYSIHNFWALPAAVKPYLSHGAVPKTDDEGLAAPLREAPCTGGGELFSGPHGQVSPNIPEGSGNPG